MHDINDVVDDIIRGIKGDEPTPTPVESEELETIVYTPSQGMISEMTISSDKRTSYDIIANGCVINRGHMQGGDTIVMHFNPPLAVSGSTKLTVKASTPNANIYTTTRGVND